MPKPLSYEHLPQGTRILEHSLSDVPGRDPYVRIDRFSRLGASCLVHHDVVFKDPNNEDTQLTPAEETAVVLGMSGLSAAISGKLLGGISKHTIEESRIYGYAKLGVANSKIAMAPTTRRLVETGIVSFEFPIEPPSDMPNLQARMRYIEGFSRGVPLGKMGTEPETTVKSRMRYLYEQLERVIDPKLGRVHDQQSMVFFAIGCGALQLETPYGPAAPLIMSPPESPHA